MNHALLAILNALKNVPSESFESEALEFKEYNSEKSLHNAKDLTEEISALANLNGGNIVIGVKDSSSVKSAEWHTQLVGFQNVDLDTTKERLLGKLKPRILNLSLYEIKFENKNYLVINVPQCIDTLVGTSSGKFYIREGKSSRPMGPDEIRDKVKSLQDYDWSAEVIDRPPSEILNLASVNEAFQNFCERRSATISIDNFYEAIGVTVNGRLTKSGLLMFGKNKDIRSNLGNFEYRFSKKTIHGELIDNDIWDDNIWETIKRAKLHFIQNNLHIEINFQDNKYTIPKLDEVAFHEAFINALVHRDYSIDGMVSIDFSNEKLAITSPGSFYGGITSENIFTHEPRHRNKALARMMMEYNLVDRAGMGVFRMSLNSLMYGRDFPFFIQKDKSVTVSMQADYFRPVVFYFSEVNKGKYGIPEYLILNSLYQKGCVPVSTLLKQLIKINENPWVVLNRAIENIDCVELCGDKKDIYVRIRPNYNELFEVQKVHRVYGGSENYVSLFNFLQNHKSATNADIKKLLGHKHTPTTSKFLRNIEYIKRSGRGVSARWSLIENFG